MEENILKLTAQLGFLGVLIFVIAAAMGRRDEARLEQKNHRDRHKNSARWNNGPVVAPKAEVLPFYQAALTPQVRYY